MSSFTRRVSANEFGSREFGGELGQVLCTLPACREKRSVYVPALPYRYGDVLEAQEGRITTPPTRPFWAGG